MNSEEVWRGFSEENPFLFIVWAILQIAVPSHISLLLHTII